MSKSSDVGGSPPQVDTSTLKNSSKASGPPRLTVSRFGPTEVIRQSLPVLGQDKRLLPLLITLSFVMGLIEAALVYLVVQIGVALAGGRDVFEFVLGPLALHDIGIVRGTVVGGILVVVLVLLLIPVARISGRLPARAQERVRLSLLDSYLGATWDIRARYPEGHLQELLTTYSTRAERAITQLVLGSIAICGLTAILLTAFLASPIAAVVAIACVAAVGLILSPLLARVRVASGAYADLDRSFAGRAAEIARLTPEVAAFDVASKVSEDVAVRAGDVAASFTRIRTLMRLGSSLYQYIALFLILVALGTASILVEGPELATIGGVLLLLVRALSYGQQLQGQVQQAQETGPFLELMREEIASLQAAQVDRSGTRIESPVPLEFCDVHFAYQPDSEVLKGITFDLQPGQSLGIVGRSGAGKSTIVQLLLRLRNPTSGYIRVNGHPLTEVSIARWAELVAYVPQDNKLIRGSVSDNIRFYRPALSEEAVRSAALKAHLHDEIIALPEGYDTEVGPGARDLSGGQRQRLGIARALAGEPELIVLDEPTSALDARSESLVTDTLIGLHGTVGTIVVAHRPATLAGCDQILRIEDGRAMIGSPPSTTSNFGLPATP